MNMMIGKEYRQLVLEGAKLIRDYVAESFGYNGNHMFLVSDGLSDISNDGRKIADTFTLENIENDFGNDVRKVGVDSIKYATHSTDDKVKNGTTTTAILSYEGMKNINDIINKRNINKIDLREYIETTHRTLTSLSLDLKHSIDDKEELLYNIAFSSCRDEEMSDFAVNVIKEHGLNWEISPYKSDEYKFSSKNGSKFKFNKVFSTSDDIDNVMFIYLPAKVNVVHIVSSLIEECHHKDKNACILVNEIDESLKLEMQHTANALGIEVMVFDIKYANATQVDDMFGIFEYYAGSINMDVPYKYSNFDNVSYDGKKVKFLNNEFKQNEYVTNRIDSINEEISDSSDYHRINVLHQRINRLSHVDKTLMLKSTNLTHNTVKDKFIDTTNYVFDAMNNGDVVIGGGVFFFKLYHNFMELMASDSSLSKDYKMVGREIAKSLLVPQDEIIRNSNQKITRKIKRKIRNSDSFGYNGKTNKYENLLDSGVIDPYSTVMTCIDSMFERISSFSITNGIIVRNILNEIKK